jgi:hypothetical protein
VLLTVETSVSGGSRLRRAEGGADTKATTAMGLGPVDEELEVCIATAFTALWGWGFRKVYDITARALPCTATAASLLATLTL